MNERNYNILIIDDDKQIIDIISQILQQVDDITIFIANNISQATNILKNNEIHLLIVDYNLPDGDGISLVEKIREESIGIKYLPVIMLSGEGDNIKLPALEKGVNMFLGKPFNAKELLAIVNNLLELLEAYESLEQANTIIAALTKAVETRDSYTEGHSQRVSKYSLELYDEIGFSDYLERKTLETGCLLHDIGKLGIPDSILQSTKELTPQERIEIEKHPEYGYDICKDLKNLRPALPIIRSHHEKLNGSGYPDGLKGDEIPIIVQIVAITDIYDALTSKRAYRTENSNKVAFEIMDKMVENGELNTYFYSVFKNMILNKA